MRPFLNTLGSLFSSEIVRLVPQSDDYSCPVCTDLAYKPSRTPNLSRVIMYFESNLLIQSYSSSKMWSHLCIRCAIHLQRRKSLQCPMCRRATVMDADSYNIDSERMRFLQMFFPTEVKRKQQANEREVAKERFNIV